MSIKRTKPRNFSGRDKEEATGPFGGKEPPPAKTWTEQVSGRADGDFAPYAMTARFTKGALISHSKFGKGVVAEVDGKRLEVLFEDGAKKLGHAG